jgi:hypothetical protein
MNWVGKNFDERSIGRRGGGLSRITRTHASEPTANRRRKILILSNGGYRPPAIQSILILCGF